MVELFNTFIDIAAQSKKFRSLVRYVADRSEGLHYGSYCLKDEVALALSFVSSHSGGAVIDIGANKGEWSKLFLQGRPNVEKLIIVEPQSSHWSALKAIGKFSTTSVVIEPVALGGKAGHAALYFDREGSPLASILKRNLSHVGVNMKNSEIVSVTTLDALVEKNGCLPISFMKLDSEGAELEILRGAEKLFAKKAIRAIAFEFGGCNIDSRSYVKDFWNLLVDNHSFSLYRLMPRRRLLYLHSYSELLERFSWQNFLACAPGVAPAWKVLV